MLQFRLVSLAEEGDSNPRVQNACGQTYVLGQCFYKKPALNHSAILPLQKRCRKNGGAFLHLYHMSL